MATGDASDHDWIFDYLGEALASPTFTAPLDAFVEEHCIVFDNDDENKLAYTEIHNKFIALMEATLEQHLSQLGMTEDDFALICEASGSSLTRRGVNAQVVDALLAAEDFESFKKMMIRKNLELEKAALQELCGDTMADAEALQLASVLKASKAEAAEALAAAAMGTGKHAPGASGGASSAASAAPSAPEASGGTGGSDSDDAMFEAALAASLAEFEAARAHAESELAELERVIQMSLLAESARIELLEREAAAAEAKAKQEAEAKARGEAQAKAQAEAKALAEAEAWAAAAAAAGAEAEQTAAMQAEEEAKAKVKEVEDAKAKEEAEAKAKLEAELKAKLDAEAKARAAEMAAAEKRRAEAAAALEATVAEHTALRAERDAVRSEAAPSAGVAEAARSVPATASTPAAPETSEADKAAAAREAAERRRAALETQKPTLVAASMAGLIDCLSRNCMPKIWLGRLSVAFALVLAGVLAGWVGIFSKQIGLCSEIFGSITAVWALTVLAAAILAVYCLRSGSSSTNPSTADYVPGEGGDEIDESRGIGTGMDVPLAGAAAAPKKERSCAGCALCIATHAAMMLCAVSACALVVVTMAGVWLVQSTQPDLHRNLALQGLTNDVTVSFDKSGIVHIDTAGDLADGYFAMGVVHAEMRLWQMEFQRRVGAGRLSEAVGSGGLSIDKLMRTLGMYEAAQAAYSTAPEDAKLAIDAYVRGVNAYLATGPPRPAEFVLLGLDKPEPWTAADSLVWAKIMSYDLSGNMGAEIRRFSLAHVHGLSPDRINTLMPVYNASRFPTALSPADLGIGSATFGCARPFVGSSAAGGGGQSAEEAERAWWTPSEGGADAVSRAMRLAREATGDALRAAEPQSDWLRGLWPSLGGGGGGGVAIRPAWELGNLGASNNWVVGGNRTSSGLPLLCNDPHLALMAPSIWLAMSMHVATGGLIAAKNPALPSGAEAQPVTQVGATFVGLPGVVIGHNGHIAWGVTNVGSDVQDLYVMAAATGQSADDYYLFQGEAVPFNKTTATIKVKGEADESIVVRRSRFGPVISDNGNFPQLQTNGVPRVDLSLRWISIDPTVNDTTIASFLRIGQARNHSEWTEALREYIAPSQNMVYADTAGHIAYRTTGMVPIREGGRDGRWPVAGDGVGNDWDWNGWIPFEAMPSTLDPPEGFIATANNRITPTGYAYTITHDWDAGSNGYRAERITDLICAGSIGPKRLTRDSMAQIQRDEVSYVARDLVAAVQAALPAAKLSGGAAQAARSSLLAWDFNATIGSEQQTTAMRLLAGVATLVSKETGSSVWNDFVFLLGAMEHGDAACGGSCADFFAKAMSNASSDDGLPKQWGVPGRHMATFTHQVLGKSAAACLADRSVPHGGDFSTINVGHGDLSNPHFPQTAGSSYRQIVDLSDLPSSLFLNPLGQSGALFSPMYDNLLRAWQDNTYLPMQSTPQKDAFSQQFTAQV